MTAHGTDTSYTHDACRTAQLASQRAYRARINASRQATS